MSPTVMNESIILKAAIDSYERHGVMLMDVPNASIQTHTIVKKGGGGNNENLWKVS